MSRAPFIVIDGSDGSGKSTQYARLCEHLEHESIAYETIKFPRYNHPSEYFVDQYLHGKYGQADDIPAKRASVFYAVDRFAASAHITEQLAKGIVVIADRYVAANMGHQGAKMADATTRREFFSWLDQFEYGIMGIPRPDVNIVLTISDQQAQRNIKKRAAEGNHAPDIHEENADFLRRSAEVYREICELFPEQYTRMDCMKTEASMLSVDIIHSEVWKIITAHMQGVKI